MRRAGWPARALRESCPRWLQEVLLVAERRLPMALAAATSSKISISIGGSVNMLPAPATARPHAGAMTRLQRARVAAARMVSRREAQRSRAWLDAAMEAEELS